MIDINLAPGADKRRAGGRTRSLRMPAGPSLTSLGPKPHVLLIGALALAVLLTLGFQLWRVGARAAELETQIAEQVTDSTRLASTIGLLDELRARQDTIRAKIDVIREVDQRRYVWPHLLDEVSRAVPAYTWLEQINSTEGADSLAAGPTLTLQGHAGSTQALTRFMKNLEASAFVRAVTLVTSEQETVEGRTVHRFTLEARYEVPDSALIQTLPLVILD